MTALKVERASLTAKSRQIETEAAPIRYVAELVGADTDSERAIRWLIALMVLYCDPLAIALTTAASARCFRDYAWLLPQCFRCPRVAGHDFHIALLVLIFSHANVRPGN